MWQFLVLGILLVLMHIVGRLGSPVNPDASYDGMTLIATGFIMLAAFSFGELLRKIRLPALLGYLLAGILLGPKFIALVFGSSDLAPLSDGVIHELGLVNVLAVGVIGTMGGLEIKIGDLRDGFRSIAFVSLSIFALVLPLVTVAVLVISQSAPELAPFAAGLPQQEQVMIAVLLAVLSCGMSPAATLALLQEVRSRGRFTSLVLGTVVFADLMLVASFLVALAMAKLAISPEGLNWAGFTHAMPHIAAEFGYAIMLGLLAGGVFILYLRFVGRETLLFALAVIFITSFACARLHAETLLAFLVAGFVVQNGSRHGHTLLHTFEQISLPVFIVYFMTQTAQLDLVALAKYFPLTIIIVSIRVASFYYGIQFGSKAAGASDLTRRNLWMCFFSQGGVDLVLAAAIAAGIPTWGADVQTVIVSTVIIYVIAGPPLLARALDNVGESAAARERGAENLGARETPTARAGPLEFSMPMAADAGLQQRLFALRELLVGIRKSKFDGGALNRAEHRTAKVLNMARSVTAIFERSAALVEQLDPGSASARTRLTGLRTELDGAIVAASRSWASRPEPAPVRIEELEAIFETLDGAQTFGSSFWVTREPELFEVKGSRWQRFVRRLRQVRRAIAGPGRRLVPLGRLWKYHVVLDVPVRIWGGLRAREAELWFLLAQHYRLTRRDLEAAIRGDLVDPNSEAPKTDDSHGHDDGHSHGHDAESHGSRARATAPAGHGLAPESGATARTGTGAFSVVATEAASAGASVAPQEAGGAGAAPLFERLQRAAQRAREREKELTRRAAEVDDHLDRALTAGLTDAWTEFMSSVDLAGTLERPAWRYRISARFDAAQAAKSELGERLARDTEAAAGHRDALTAIVQCQRFAQRTRDYLLRLRTHVENSLEAALAQFSAPLASCRDEWPNTVAGGLESGALKSPDASDSGSRAAAERAAPSAAHREEAGRAERLLKSLEGPLNALERLSHEVSHDELLAVRGLMPERALFEVPEDVAPISSPSVEPSVDRVDRRAPLRLRAWAQHSMLQASTDARASVEEELEVALGMAVTRLHHAQQVVEYYAADVVGGGALDAEFALRIGGMVEQARDDLREAAVVANDKLLASVEASLASSLELLEGARWEEIRRKLRRAGEAERVATQRAALGEWVRGRWHALRTRAGPVLAELRDEVDALFAESIPPAVEEDFRELVFGAEDTAARTPTYQRLFSSVPAESVGLVVERPEFEWLREGIEAFAQGRGGPLLVYGERGVGRRTAVRWLVGQTSEELEYHWVRLSPSFEREFDVGKDIATTLGLRPVRDFSALGSSIRAAMASAVRTGETKPPRSVVFVIENAERLFRRTPEGLARMRRFLELVSVTGRDVGWIVLTTDSAVRVLDPILEIRARFATAVAMPPADAALLEAIISARHRLSALQLVIERRFPRLTEWVRHPGAAFRSLRGPYYGIFERLALLSGGNVRQALRYWLALSRVEGGESGRAIVRPLVAVPTPLLRDLPLPGRVILAALCLHGPLRRTDLVGLQVQGALDIDSELARLEHLHLIQVERTPGQRENDVNVVVRVESRVLHSVTEELTQCNLM